MTRPIKTMLAALLVLTTLCATAQTYDFKLTLKKGQKYNQSMAMDMNIKESINGQEMKIGTKAHFVFSQEVKAVDNDGNYVIENSYKRVALDVSAMGTNISYDSDKKPEAGTPAEELGKTFSSVIGKKFTLTLSPKGKVISVTGMSEILNDLSKSASPTSKQLLASTFDEKKMAANFSSSYDFFPDHAVKKGESWKRKTTVESLFPIDLESTYTLKEVNGNTAVIGMGADIVMKKDDVQMQGMSVNIDLKGKYDGDYNMDISTGLSTSATLAMPVKGTLEMMSTKVPLEMNITVETTTKPAK